MVLAAVLAAISAIVGYTISGVQSGLSLLNTFFQMLPDKLKHIVFGSIILAGGVFWVELTNALGFKLMFFGIDMTVAPLAVALVLAFLAIATEIFQWYSFWR